MNETLSKLLEAARKDPVLKEKLLQTRRDKDPMDSFCKLATELGYPITIGELVAMGENFCDDWLISINGGATYPIEYWGDMYELFFSSLNF